MLPGLGGHSVALIDMAVQTALILCRHTIHQLDPDARARLNSAFIATFFVGGAAGSQLGSVVHHAGSWTTLTILGAALPWIGPPQLDHRTPAARGHPAERSKPVRFAVLSPVRGQRAEAEPALGALRKEPCWFCSWYGQGSRSL
ncbi:hypothetical protein ACFRQM_35870 [Streptomyces sp. NPDC056831]|uniref:hypothetical protein n=1 Tax=Streptomyces sp. NPDC056831 TaxID=3345954 RepID=UPI0036865B25